MYLEFDNQSVDAKSPNRKSTAGALSTSRSPRQLTRATSVVETTPASSADGPHDNVYVRIRCHCTTVWQLLSEAYSPPRRSSKINDASSQKTVWSSLLNRLGSSTVQWSKSEWSLR